MNWNSNTITGNSRSEDPAINFPERCRTANEAAAAIYPKIARHHPAFREQQGMDSDQIPTVRIVDLNDEFWASTLGPFGTHHNPVVFCATENQFRRYDPESGLYEPVSEAVLVNALLRNLDYCAEFFPPNTVLDSFFILRNKQRLKSVVDCARDLLAVEVSSFEKNMKLRVPVINGVLQIDNRQLNPHHPGIPVTRTLPVKYDPDAKCEIFIKSFLNLILEAADVDLLQRYCSQILDGHNYSQKILILTGVSSWGKSSLLKILGSIVGWERVGIVRDRIYRDEFELGHYSGKHLLYHPDMPTDFLDRREASLFKQLVGGDPLWADVKGEDGRITLQGNYPIIFACNGKPRIHLDEDADAWTRRLAILSFKRPPHETHIGKLADLILERESSGILNWLLEGRAKLVKDRLQLMQTNNQQKRTATLLMQSESPRVFVRCCIKRQKGGIIWMADLYENYQEWCRSLHLSPVASKEFMQGVKVEIETGFGLRPRHDLAGNDGKAKRGWAGLSVVVEEPMGENAGKGSEMSA